MKRIIIMASFALASLSSVPAFAQDENVGEIKPFFDDKPAYVSPFFSPMIMHRSTWGEPHIESLPVASHELSFGYCLGVTFQGTSVEGRGQRMPITIAYFAEVNPFRTYQYSYQAPTKRMWGLRMSFECPLAPEAVPGLNFGFVCLAGRYGPLHKEEGFRHFGKMLYKNGDRLTCFYGYKFSYMMERTPYGKHKMGYVMEPALSIGALDGKFTYMVECTFRLKYKKRVAMK